MWQACFHRLPRPQPSSSSIYLVQACSFLLFCCLVVFITVESFTFLPQDETRWRICLLLLLPSPPVVSIPVMQYCMSRLWFCLWYLHKRIIYFLFIAHPLSDFLYSISHFSSIQYYCIRTVLVFVLFIRKTLCSHQLIRVITTSKNLSRPFLHF